MSPSPTPLLDRRLFDMPDDVLWLAHCKDGPVPRASLAAMQRVLDTELRPWDLDWQSDFLDIAAALRHEAALLLGASPHDISLTTCTTTGLEAASLGYPWRPGDQVVIPLGEFPSNRLPWMALAERGVSCTEVPLWPGHGQHHATPPTNDMTPEQALIDAITPHTRVMAVSWVRYQDGIRLDLTRLGQACRERGVHLVVDGIQGAGTVDMALDGVSAMATGGHKGLLGLQGQGFLWTDPTFRSLLLPLGTWLSAPEASSQVGKPLSSDERWSSDGRRLEGGSPSILSCAVLAASLALINNAGGAAAMQRHIAQLQSTLLQHLDTSAAWHSEAQRLRALLDAQRLGSILSFALPHELCHARVDQALRRGIHASAREGYLRIAFHGWHGASDVARAAEWLLGEA